MNDRARAISVLQQARDILAERLTERILESRDSILEDALGLSYSSEIDAVQEQLGMRLNNVHMLLNNLPPMDDSSSGAEEDEESTSSSPIAMGYEPEMPPSAVIELPGNTFYADSTFHDVKESAVVVASPQPAVQPTVISLQAFAERVSANDVEGAGTVLAGLFDVSGPRGRECAKRFQEQLAERPQFLQKAMGLRLELASGSVNGALLVLWECFGLQGLESIAALQALKTRFGLGSN
ncbi:MAG: hypothetical protein K8U03_17815 [Planctomycetia bacterium]|nr:hypothetical protein [Planctomycetia bacterium]